jgi:hypothetical protein
MYKVSQVNDFKNGNIVNPEHHPIAVNALRKHTFD